MFNSIYRYWTKPRWVIKLRRYGMLKYVSVKLKRGPFTIIECAIWKLEASRNEIKDTKRYIIKLYRQKNKPSPTCSTMYDSESIYMKEENEQD